MATLDELKEKVATIIQDSDEKLKPEDIESCIGDALEHFNKDIPRKIATKYTPTDDSTDFDYPEGWDEELSEIRAIEYPIDMNPPEFLDPEDDWMEVELEMTAEESGDTHDELDNWEFNNIVFGFNTSASRELWAVLTDSAGTRKVEIYKDSAKTLKVAEGTKVGDGTLSFTEQNNSGISGTVDVTYHDGEPDIVLALRNKVIRFFSAPGTGNSFRLLWTQRIKDADDLGISRIPARFVGAFAQLCAHYCAKSLAFKYANTSDPSLAADVVDYKTKSTFYQDLAELTLEEFEKVALESSRTMVAHGVKDLDVDFAWKEEKLFHRRRHR